MTNLSDTLAALSEAANWLRECSDWLLSNDLDMTCPMQTDPLDLAEALEAIRTGQLVPVPSVEKLIEALEWYGEQARLARLIHSEGDAGRHALQADGGKRATAVIAAMQDGRDG